MKKFVYLCMSLMVITAGCTSPTAERTEVTEQPLSYTADSFPEWSGIDHRNQTWTSEALNQQTAFVAYFSAPWCTHCEPTIDSYDQVIPSERMMVFSRESREEYADMLEWHNRTENNLNRTIDRPFVLLPSLAQTLDVQSIPHAIFVNEQGYIYNVQIGKRTNLTAIGELWELTLRAQFDAQIGWTYEE